MTLKFGTKAETLILLKDVIKSAKILDSIVFSCSDWWSDRNLILGKILKGKFIGPWIVRSSAISEDGFKVSNAGKFNSVLNVSNDELGLAVDDVIKSYGKRNKKDQVFIQPMLQNVIFSGVAFSHDPSTCAPYRIINWAEGNDTTAVTAGKSSYSWQCAANSPKNINVKFAKILLLIEELLVLFKQYPIDLEFAVTKNGSNEKLWLLQVRPLILNSEPETETQQEKKIKFIRKKITQGMKPHPFLMGKSTVYGVMPDWNPAEIVGIRPKPLALSLYRELVTDSIWAYQRNNYGYRNLRSFPLMPNFFGLPYVDVRLSFNSFIPSDLNEELAGKLVDYYINRLLEKPALHDKVEFEIVFSCYTLDISHQLEKLRGVGFSRKDIKELSNSLRNITNKVLHPQKGLWLSDAKKIQVLEDRRNKLYSAKLDTIETIYWLLEDAKRYGTLPFAGLARAGFIAIQMLRSLLSVGIFSQEDYDNFLSSVSTVSGQLMNDRRTMDKVSFLERYGHLRPGTYDILSLRYDEAPDLYFDWNQEIEQQKKNDEFELSKSKEMEISDLLRVHEIESDAKSFIDFIKSAIELRELAKFYFTKNLSDSLSLICDFGNKLGVARDDLAFLDVHTLHNLHFNAGDRKVPILKAIKRNKASYKETLKLSLPPLITNPDDVWAFKWPETEPNFITQKKVVAKVVTSESRDLLIGSLVCIPSADPGFDWLFSYPIAGLITAWGGVNSHMAIRASELGLPAVIGSGETLYRHWASANTLLLDCAGRRVEVLS